MFFKYISNTADKKAAYEIFVGFYLIRFNQDLEHFHKTIVLF